MIKSVLITGANAGLGKEAAKQLADRSEIEKIYLACRNPEKAKVAKQELEVETGRHIFEILVLDVSNLHSVRAAVKDLAEPVDALVMNAGGTGGKHFNQLNEHGVTEIFAVNLLGHSVLTEELIKAEKLTQVAIYAGSEAARGVKEMGMKQPEFKDSSVDEFVSVCDGSMYGDITDATIPYGPIKYMGAMWMSSMARRYTQIKFITMSPGATTGTEGFNSLSFLKQYMMKAMMRVMLWVGKVHKVETGAQRYLRGLFDTSLSSGAFYASQKGLSGPIGEQSKLFNDLANQKYQDNVYQAIQRFVN